MLVDRNTWHHAGSHADRPGGIKPTTFCSFFSSYATAHQSFACLSTLSPENPRRPPDVLSKDEFLLRQKVEPFIYYTDKHGAFECVTHQSIEAAAAKVGCRPPILPQWLAFKLKLSAPHCGSRANTACWRPS